MLRTKYIFAPAEPEDGVRISVMSRHTQNDGKSENPNFYEGIYDDWRLILAPPLTLVGGYHRGEINWEEFEAGYRLHIGKPLIERALEQLTHEANETDVTIMCGEETPEHCHRRLIAERCQLILPSLVVVIN